MKPESERLFFALWPNETVRQQLVEACAQIANVRGQRSVLPGNLHLTLHFLGNIELSRVDCFRQQAEIVSADRFSLEINRMGYFKKPRVLWLGCEQLPDQLIQLHASLGAQIQACGFRQEQRPYHPHITMARKLTQAPPSIPIKPIEWDVNEFVLIQSFTHAAGVEYRVKQAFPFTGGAC